MGIMVNSVRKACVPFFPFSSCRSESSVCTNDSPNSFCVELEYFFFPPAITALPPLALLVLFVVTVLSAVLNPLCEAELTNDLVSFSLVLRLVFVSNGREAPIILTVKCTIKMSSSANLLQQIKAMTKPTHTVFRSLQHLPLGGTYCHVRINKKRYSR